MLIKLFIAIPVSMLCFGIGYIWESYIHGPGKSISEGLSDWWHESDDDI